MESGLAAVVVGGLLRHMKAPREPGSAAIKLLSVGSTVVHHFQVLVMIEVTEVDGTLRGCYGGDFGSYLTS